jgi:arylsulfatase A-like enzyme
LLTPAVRRRLAGALFAFAASIGATACTRGPTTDLPRPLVVIGVDGLEWKLALDLAAAGRIPEISKLAREGSFVRTSTINPTLSPPIWTSMATGVIPDRHGIEGFVRPFVRGENDEPLLYTNRERRVKAVWNIASESGVRSCIVGYWMTFPVEPIEGVMVAQTGTPPGSTPEHQRKGSLQPGASGQVHPPDYEARAFELAASSQPTAAEREKELFGDTSAWPAAMKRLAEHSRWSIAADTAYQQIALDLVSGSHRCDLVVVYLGLPDVLGHRFWRWTYPGDFASPPPQAEVETYGEVLRRAYAQVDRFVGEMRRAAGTDATVIVTSDHGMGPFRPKQTVNIHDDSGELLRTGGHSAARDGFFTAAGRGIAVSSRDLPASFGEVPGEGSVVDLAPTLLALLGLPRGSDMDGFVMTGLLEPRFVAAHPLREVPTHTPKDWMASRRFAATGDIDNAARLEQLRGLGYLE